MVIAKQLTTNQQTNMSTDHYVVLQVARGATPKEIRSAYRRRARELHPDKSGKGSEPFLELQEAYSVLSNPERRSAYDQAGEEVPIRRGPRGGRRRAEPLREDEVERAAAFREVSLAHSFETFGPSFEEIFDRWWSNFDLLSRRPKGERLESLRVDIPLSREESLRGGTFRLLVPARLSCRACGGEGRMGFYRCWRCQGQGSVLAEYPVPVGFPSGLRGDYVVRVPLADFGISNFYLTVRFRPVQIA